MASLTPEELVAKDKASLFHAYTSIADHLEHGPRIMESGRGVWLTDVYGHEYLDAMAGLWCVNVGYGRTEIAEAMARQSEHLSYYHSFLSNSNPPAIELADRLIQMTPPNMRTVFFANSGSEANETNIKLVWYYNNLRGKPQKKKIIARQKAYHGVMLGSTSLSGLAPMHAHFDAPLDRFLHTTTPHYYRFGHDGESEEEFARRCARDLEELIHTEGADTIAAFIAEPIMGAGGVIVPPHGYWDAITPVLKEHDILLIDDEVICGFGRLGTAFGCDAFDFTPDIMTLAKGLTSCYFPVSASVVGESVWNVIRDESAEHGPFAHGNTTSAHPVGAATALANLDIMDNEKLFEHAASVGEYMQSRLREEFAEHPRVGEVRGRGLIAGVELVADKETRAPFPPESKTGMRLHKILLEEGVINRPIVDTLAWSPPLIITRDEIDEAIRRFHAGLARLDAEMS